MTDEDDDEDDDDGLRINTLFITIIKSHASRASLKGTKRANLSSTKKDLRSMETVYTLDGKLQHWGIILLKDYGI